MKYALLCHLYFAKSIFVLWKLLRIEERTYNTKLMTYKTEGVQYLERWKAQPKTVPDPFQMTKCKVVCGTCMVCILCIKLVHNVTPHAGWLLNAKCFSIVVHVFRISYF